MSLLLEAPPEPPSGTAGPSSPSGVFLAGSRRPKELAPDENTDTTRELERQLRQAQKMVVVGQLAAGVAHDFNNILSVIQGHAGLLEDNPRLPRDAMDSVREVAQAARRAAALTRQLLAFSRDHAMEAVPLDLRALVDGLHRMLGRLIGEVVKLKCELPAALPAVVADARGLEQVLLNLAVNARDAMPEGGFLLIRAEALTVDEAHVKKHPEARLGQFVCLSVTDTGYGMDSAVLDRLFEPFFTTKESGKGTGLGLAIVYGIVRQHEGWIEVVSRPGFGSSFRVYLPQALAPDGRCRIPRVAEGGQRDQKAAGGTETILVVEDEPAVRMMAARVLEHAGYKILVACDGIEALELWRQHEAKVDLLLTDMVLPEGVSGRRLAEMLFAEKPDLKVVYTSGYSLPGTDALQGPDGERFLAKPFDVLRLESTVRKCLDAPPTAPRSGPS